jgi:transcriptional regulator with GAF, ATPase, and Fis domain
MNRDSIATVRLIGACKALRAIDTEIDSAAQSHAKVLITGETGVGKEVVARLVHQRSARRHARLATINCAGFPDSLLESELFGHVRGSFTDAYRDKPGLFESADNGTVFLDEVGEMSARMQSVLLRFLETGELQRVGAGRVSTSVNVRVIAATNRDLLKEVNAGTFRGDLYYRLNVVRIHVPPLRERREDIPLLLEYFLGLYSGQYGVACREISPEAMDLLVRYRWPGNIRELRNVVEQLAIKAAGTTVMPVDLPVEVGRRLEEFHPVQPIEAAEPTQSLPHALIEQMVDSGESFWSTVYPLFMNRDLSRAQLRAIVKTGLEMSGGNYRIMTQKFNMPVGDYKRFLSFLRKHDCSLSFRSFREFPLQRAGYPKAVERHAHLA